MTHVKAVNVHELHAQFLSILPRIERHARIYFRDLKCSHRKEDAVQEVAALSWRWFVRLVQQGKNPLLFPSAIATYAAKAVKSGRRVTGQERTKDALSPLGRQRHDFTVSPLPDAGSPHRNDFDDALAEHTASPVPDQVAFKLDFPAWLQTHDDRHQRIIEDMLLGERTLEVANRHHLSPGRISQLRRLFHQTWCRFHGEPAA